MSSPMPWINTHSWVTMVPIHIDYVKMVPVFSWASSPQLFVSIVTGELVTTPGTSLLSLDQQHFFIMETFVSWILQS